MNLLLRLWMAMTILGMALAACRKNDDPLPTVIDPIAYSTQLAADNTETAVMLMTLTPVTMTPTFSPTPSPTRTPSPTLTLTPTYTPSRTLTPIPTLTRPPSNTPTPTWTQDISGVPTITATPTDTPIPSDTPTRVVNPDAIVGDHPAPLRVAPAEDALAVTELPVGTALGIDLRTADNLWLQIHLLNGMGNGWVATADLIVLTNLNVIEIYGGDSSTPSGIESPTAPFTIADDLMPPQKIDLNALGNGLPFQPYNYGACGLTYWTGDGVGLSMEDLVVAGRYPRFAADPIYLYVYGIGEMLGEDRADWELAISETIAELSQAVRLERVFLDDLDFFQPWVPMETILADRRVDMVWHIVPAEEYAANVPCSDENSCSQYAFEGAVMGGPLRFGGAVYTRLDVPEKRRTLVHATLHALGLWIHSDQPDDLLARSGIAQRMSLRDIQTLRCLYNAPPYGDGVVE
jgi:hypothetical protein